MSKKAASLKRIRVVALALIASAAPLAFTTQGTVRINNACAQSSDLGDGSCCPADAICGLNGQNFFNADFHPGPCH